ncbi:MAG: VIT domain-containing protein [Kofleriaceae bacterium]
MTTERDDDILEQNLSTLLPGAGQAAPDAPARARMRARLLARHGHDRPARSPVAMVGWGLVAAAAGAVVIANVGHRGSPAAPPPAVAAPGARTDLIKLADGTTAELGAGGKVTPLGPRQIRVDGEVLLDVAPGQGTFTVETGQGQLAVLGTRFLVEASGDRTVTSVLRGAVALRSGGHQEVLHAGEQGVMQTGVRPTRGPAPRLSHLVSWVAERRRLAERPDAGPVRTGALVARNPQWQEQEYPLPMRAFTLDVHLENQVARVALDQTFTNPHDQTLEGVYKFALPPGAAVARLAMYVDGTLQESAVVERMAARRIYEDIVYQRRDPALLEQMGASLVSMRIFPLAPHQDKRVILAYTQPLARTYDDVTLTVPMPALDQPVGDVAMRVRVVGCAGCEIVSPSHAITVEPSGADAVVRYHGTDQRLDDSLVLRVRQVTPAVTAASTIADAQRYLLVRARPTGLATQPAADRPSRWVILDDTSASRGPAELAAQAALVDRLVDDIDEHDQVMVVAFDATHRRFNTWQDAMAIDRAALRAFLAKDAGLGETDLGEALAGAAQLLDGQPGYVVYVGDGTATGERRTIDQLRDALTSSRATFIGLGVGDGVDLSTLGALADATGGLATTIDLGDDLAWRSLDLVASLYTPRLTGLTATVDGAGPDASVLVRSRQVAAGEDIELVVRAPARDDLRAVTLRGTSGGQPWTQTVTVASAAPAPGDGGYLPRLWAQRRLEQLTTAGDRALAPCAQAPCPTDEERAIAAYHARKAEMVALGTEHFLLSQHTSLIVLENDAMYRQYGVRKGAGSTWAPYQVPATIATSTTPAPAPIASDAPLWRQPLQWRYVPDASADLLLGSLADESSGGFGFGVIGTRGGGTSNGTGQGFGVGSGRLGTIGRGAGGGGTRTRRAEAPVQAEAQQLAEQAPVTAADKLDSRASAAGDAKAVLPSGSVAGPPPPPAAEPDSPDPAPWGASGTEHSAAAASVTAAPVGKATATSPRDVARSSADAAEAKAPARRAQVPWGLAAGEADREFDSNRQALRFPRLMPVMLQTTGDWRLDDVTVWLPGLARTDYDVAADALAAAGGGGAGSITSDAAALLTSARASLGAGVWTVGDATVTVDRQGRIAQTRTLELGVVEELTYDGAALQHRYPQFGLATTRTVGDLAPAVWSTLLPVVPPPPAALARWYRVTKVGDRELALAPVAGGATRQLTLASDGTVARLTEQDGSVTRTLVQSARTSAGWSVTLGDRRVLMALRADPTVTVPDAPATAVTLELPLTPLAEASAQAGQALAGSAAWRHLQHQRAASALAAGVPGVVAQAVRDLVTAGPLTPPELALTSGGARWLDAATLAKATGAQPDAIAALVAATGGGRKARWRDVAALPGPVGLLAEYHQLLAAIDAGDRAGALSGFRTLRARPGSELVALIGALRLAQTFAWSDPAALDVLDQVAVGRDRNVVRAEAATLAGYGRGGAMADRWIALISDVDLAATPPVVDPGAYYAVLSSPRGQVGWNHAMSLWRDRVLADGDVAHVLAYARAASLSTATDLDPALDRAVGLADGDPAVVREAVALAARAGRAAKAQALVDAALVRTPGEPSLLRLAARAAADRGDTTQAAALLEQALDREADRPVSLAQLRADYQVLISLHGTAAGASAGPVRERAVEAALVAGRAWRAMDPDNAARERALAEVLLAAGRDDEAWRYLSSPIDRAPREGASFQSAAEVLERTGHLAQALGLWRRAFAIDATNPTWLQRQAMTELALGRHDDAKATVQKILDRRWHVRWDGVRWWAQDARRSL